MQKTREWLIQYSLPILTAFLLVTSFIPFPPWALFLGWTPLMWFWISRTKTWKEVFWGGWITQFTFSMIGFHWIAHTAHEFGQIPWGVAILVLLIFSTLVHLWVPLAGLAWWFLKKYFSPSTSIFLVVICLILGELTWPSIFAWNFGYPWLSSRLPGFHLADTIGFDGLSAITFLINGWSLWIWTQRSQIKKVIPPTVALVVFFVSIQLLGYWRSQNLDYPDAEFRVLQVQANIGNADKIEAENGKDGYQEEILRRFLELTQKGLDQFPKTQIIIWPETAFPDFFNSNYKFNELPNRLLSYLREKNKALIVGAYSKDPPGPGIKNEDRQVYNGLFLIDEYGQYVGDPYHKTVLLAFGEYYPFTERFPILQKWFDVSNFGRGPGPSLLTWPEHDIRFGAQICYEGLYPWFSRELAKKGANVLVNVTNDSWFGKAFEPKQHLYITLGRAIETRIPLIRNTNTGITTAILADGTLLEQSPLHEEWVGEFKIPYKKNPDPTFYVRYGHLWPIFIVLALFGLYMIPKRKGSRARK
ncbi:MAG: apolipoprotein N-acyltransferase [Pseudobdellovibrionaceae bacterium]